MSNISASKVKELRQITGAGMMDCKNALKEVDGDFDKAVDFLRKKGLAAAAKKAGRATKEGSVGTYVHAGGKLGVMVEVNCETDFVAKNENFQAFVRDLAMHIAAAAPVCVSADDMPADFIEKEKEIIMGQMKEDPKMAGKPENVLNQILEGKVKKIYDEQCLLNQKFVKNPDQTVGDFVKETISTLGENMSVRRFARFSLGE